jgi:hypothetical protein
MIRELASTALLLICSGSALSQTKTINSHGDHNVNTNGDVNVLVIVEPTTPPEVKKGLKAAAKRSSGSEKEWQGVLTPGNEPAGRNNPCVPAPVPEKGVPFGGIPFLVHLGDFGILCHNLPCKVLSTGGHTLLEMFEDHGTLRVKAEVYGPDKKIIASLNGSQFRINRNNVAWPPERPDAHSLIVIDQYNNPVFNFKYNNVHEATITGVFFGPNGNSVEIEETALRFHRSGFNKEMTIMGGCNSDNGETNGVRF